ncbi:MAG: phenylacetate-CoA oxygenase subunit PaaJ [Oligoflexia bacterium]|nr:phenylacetate-CoA oxygenase subunit PaaJ [Oligoflexia bacterium]
MLPSHEQVWRELATIPDPEIPAISIVDLGIVRDVQVDGGAVRISITPTYSGCPAMRLIEDQIKELLTQDGFSCIEVKTVYAPAWTTDWLSPDAKQRLKASGIAPPQPATELVAGPKRRQPLACPFCDSTQTELRSEFGPTACKAIYFCNSCRQPFEHFKNF